MGTCKVTHKSWVQSVQLFRRLLDKKEGKKQTRKVFIDVESESYSNQIPKSVNSNDENPQKKHC